MLLVSNLHFTANPPGGQPDYFFFKSEPIQ